MRALGIFLLAYCAAAQEPVAPSVNERVGPVRGETAGGYNVVSSFELGYRFAAVSGSREEYRADVNFLNGMRLFASSLTVHSRDGHGRWFDEIVLTTQGLGNDPYQSAVLRVRKNELYEYGLLWRSNDYFNPGLIVSGGLHSENTTQRWQDQDLTLLPHGKLRILAGYSRMSRGGPALSSIPGFDQTGDPALLFSKVREEWNEYRIGADYRWRGFQATVQRRWEFYKEDTPYRLFAPDPANLTEFHSSQPYHGSTGGWLANLRFEGGRFAANGRFTYAAGNRGFLVNETTSGAAFGFAQSRQVAVRGDAQRPVTTGDLALSYFTNDRLTVSNNTSFHNTRIDGTSAYSEFDNATFAGATLYFQFLGIRLVTNSTDVHYRVSKSFDAFGGYAYADRQIRSVEQSLDAANPPASRLYAQQGNLQHAGIFGFNWTPLSGVRLRVEEEVGHNTHPFTPTAERNYQALSARISYRVKKAQFNAGYRENYNNNSLTITAYSSHARNVFAGGAWALSNRLSLDATYSRQHLDTAGGLVFFAGEGSVALRYSGFSSLYRSNLHAGNAGLRFAATKRFDLYAGYAITRDSGDGRSAGSAAAAGSVAELLSAVQTFPLTYQSPAARVSLKLHEKLRWNAGYQYYGYHEDFSLFGRNRNYRANTGYTSLLWSF